MILGTHDGGFHADDVFATTILKEVMDVEKVIRTRDSVKLQTCDLIFDVGNGQFDHHSKDKKYRNNGIPYAACGLIWKEYGKVYIKNLLNRFKLKYDENLIDSIFIKLDNTIIQQIDAADNGIKIINNTLNNMVICDLSNVIENFNIQWYETYTSEKSDNQFMEAVKFSKNLLENKTINIYYALKGKDILLKQYQKSKKEYIVLDEFMPWKTSIHEIDPTGKIKFIIFQGSDGNWNVQCVPKILGEFQNRLDLPKEWAGLRNEELAEKTGINDSIFCHVNLFLAVFKTKQSAIKCAEKVLEQVVDSKCEFRILDENKNDKVYILQLNCNINTLNDIMNLDDYCEEVSNLEEMYGTLDFCGYDNEKWLGYSSYEVEKFEELLNQFKSIFYKYKLI